MPTYSRTPAEVGHVIDRIMETYHGRLRDAGVKVESLFAHPTTDKNGDPTGPALTHHGYEAAAVVRVLGLKDRTAGRADAEIVIDKDNWDILGESECDALIDHELEHLELVTDKDGLVKRDDLDRPKLRLRKHDRQYGWFDSIARRHGEASPEVRQAREFYGSDVYRQMYLPGMEAESHRPELAMAAGEE